MSTSDKAKAFFTYALWGRESVHLLADHLSDENAKDANYATSVLGFTRTPIRQDLIRIAVTLSDPVHSIDDVKLKPMLDRIRFVLESNKETKADQNLRLIINEDIRVRRLGIDLALGRIDAASFLPDKLCQTYPEICLAILKEIDIHALLGEKGVQSMTDTALTSSDPIVRTGAVYGLRHTPNHVKLLIRILGSNPKPDVVEVLKDELHNVRPTAEDFLDLIPLFRSQDKSVSGIIDQLIGLDISDEPTPRFFAALEKELGATANSGGDRALLYIALMRSYWPKHRALVRKAYGIAKDLRSVWLPFLAVQIVNDKHFEQEVTTEAKDYLLSLLETDMEPARKDFPFRITYFNSDVIRTLENESKSDPVLKKRYLEIVDRRLSSGNVIWYDFELASSINRLGVGLSKYRSRFLKEFKEYRLRDINVGLLALMGGDELDLAAEDLNSSKTSLPSKEFIFGIIESAWSRQPDVRRFMVKQLDSGEPVIRGRAALALAEHGILTPKSEAILGEQATELKDVDSLLRLQSKAIHWFIKTYRAQLKAKTGPPYRSVRSLGNLLKKTAWNEEVFQVFCEDLAAGYTDHDSPYRRAIIADYLSHAPRPQVEKVLKFVCAQLDRPVASMSAQPDNDIYIAAEDAPSADGWHAFSPLFAILESYAPNNRVASAKLVDLLKSTEFEKRLFALRAIGLTVSDPQKVKSLVEPLLHDPSLTIRRNAAFVLDGVGLRIRDVNPEYRKVIVENFQIETMQGVQYTAPTTGLIPDSFTPNTGESEHDVFWGTQDGWPNPPRPAHIVDITSEVSFDGKFIESFLKVLDHQLPGGGNVAEVGGGFAVASGCYPIESSVELALKGQRKLDRPNWLCPNANIQLAGPVFLENPGHYRILQIVVSSLPYGAKSKRIKFGDLPYFDTNTNLSMKGKHAYLLEYRFERMADGTVVDEDGHGNWVTAKELGLTGR